MSETFTLLGFLSMGPMEMMIIGMVAVLLFGSKLPEVAKSLGSSYRDFRKGLHEIQTSIHMADSKPTKSYTASPSYDDFDDYDEPDAPRFEPPPAIESSQDSPATSEATADSDERNQETA